MLAVVPIKSFHCAKQRLSPLLDANERAGLSAAMARDVLSALCATPEIHRVVICGDEEVAGLAGEFDLEFIAEKSLGASDLNTAVNAIAAHFLRTNVRELLIVHADLPLLQPVDIRAVVHAVKFADVAIAPDSVLDGSNLLAWQLDCGFSPNYGVGSFARHCEQAQARDLLLRICKQPSARWDIDKPADLLTFLVARPHQRALHTHAFLQSSGIATRLNTGRSREFISGTLPHAHA
ncbi:MAG: 2-phospho-L-lactate guanylyltransferase [Spongiibacteraceae bacterium]